MQRAHACLLLATLALSMATRVCFASDANDPWQFTDIDGQVHRPFDDDSNRGIAVIFISTDCPIANAYQPALKRLAEQYRDNGIQLYLVHPDPSLSLERAQQHTRDFEITLPVIIDTEMTIARRLGATVTPQAFVLRKGEEMPIYQGRIDNLYADYGRKRRMATTRELADALEAIVNDQPPAVSRTAAIGCLIAYE